ncbi:sugar isomerase domain-containing protein [Aeromonas sobria]|nr:sugar isomerase domain-containing protein [Aeromonas sobria]
MNHLLNFKNNIFSIIEKISETQMKEIDLAAEIFKNTVKNKGIIYSIGSGHSFAGAIEFAGRAGGFVNTRALDNFYGHSGWFENIEGVGEVFSSLLDLQSHDAFVIISNSGNKALQVELAQKLKKTGIKIIAIVNRNDADKSIAKHSSGLKLADLADVVIDNCCFKGDCSIEMPESEVKVGPTSSIAVAYIANCISIRATEMLVAAGISLPILRSINQLGDNDYNLALLGEYKSRVFTI